jgi:alpha-L-fucosidase 2
MSTVVIADSAGNALGSLSVDPAKTTGWNDWYESETEIELPAGEQTLVLQYSGGESYLLNIDWFELEATSSTTVIQERVPTTLSVHEVKMSRATLALMVNVPGNKAYTAMLYDANGHLVSRKAGSGTGAVQFTSLKSGVYIAVVRCGSATKTLKMKLL